MFRTDIIPSLRVEWFIWKISTSLPLYDVFYCKLKDKNIYEEDQDEQHGKNNYAELQNIWKEQNMSKFEDFLVYNNNLDVGPFVEAVMKMQQFYFDKHIDVFKNTVRVPRIDWLMIDGFYGTSTHLGHFMPKTFIWLLY